MANSPTSIDYKVRETLESIQQYGLNGSLPQIQLLYQHVLGNLPELENLALFQIAGTLFSVLATQNYQGLTRFPNMAYYCLTQGTKTMQPIADINICMQNRLISRGERAKLLLNGALKLISDRIYVIDDMPHQQAFDLSVLGDILILRNEGYHSSESWWPRALEDAQWIRNNYSHFSEMQIIDISDAVHKAIAKQVYKDLDTFAHDFGYA